MKKYLFIIALILISAGSYAQSGRSIYNKYSDAPDVSAVFISPAVFDMIGTMPNMSVNDIDVNLAPIIKSLKGFYLLDSENKSVSSLIVSDVEKLVKDQKYELMMEVKEDGEKVKMYITMKGDYVSSLVMLVIDEEETVFINLDGMMDRKELEKLMVSSLNSSHR
jgi:hypothetical protein